MAEKFDVIVVGAGPAGLSAAYKLAEAGRKVIVIERGDYPGVKNVMGGILYRKQTEAIIPEFYKEAPLERPIIEQRIMILTEKASMTLGYKDPRYLDDISAYSVFRAKFDRWFAKKVEGKGALIITETVVDDLIVKDGKVVGVKVRREEGELFADVVVLAEGVHCLLTQRHGLQKAIPAKNIAVAVKEVIGLPKEVIEDRFGLNKGEGTAIEFFGEASAGMIGIAFIYTNQNSVSVGVGALVSDILKTRLTPHDLIERFKSHPAVQPLLKNGEPKEYLAHLIPEGGYRGMPQLTGDGVVVVGDAGMMVNAIHREGSNMAMTSGLLAAKAIIQAGDKGDFSRNSLRAYEKMLEDSYVIKDLKKYRDAKEFLEHNRDVLTVYPELAADGLFQLLMVDGVPKKDKFSALRRSVTSRRSLWSMAKDAYGFWKGMIR